MDPEGALPLPAFVGYPIFPFTGDLRVRPLDPPEAEERPRPGDPGGPPCPTCATGDDAYVWVDDRWRVRAPERVPGVPILVFLEAREHLDLDQLDERQAAELGPMVLRLERALQGVGGIGRVHFSRWGDGDAHFHMWFYGRPLGARQMLGFCLPMWSMILPPVPDDVWRANLAVVGEHLSRDGGRAIG